MIKIISGFQTGADLAAIDFAIENGIPYGGCVPKGRKYELGRLPEKYICVESTSSQYPPRTAKNVADSDITIIFHVGDLGNESGCALTVRLCQKANKPHVVQRLDVINNYEAADFLRPIFTGGVYKVINVAGSRESKAPGIYERVKAILKLACAPSCTPS